MSPASPAGPRIIERSSPWPVKEIVEDEGIPTIEMCDEIWPSTSKETKSPVKTLDFKQKKPAKKKTIKTRPSTASNKKT